MRIQSHLKNLRISLFGNKTGTMDAKQNRLSINIQILSRFVYPEPGSNRHGSESTGV